MQSFMLFCLFARWGEGFGVAELLTVVCDSELKIDKVWHSFSSAGSRKPRASLLRKL